MAPKVHPLSKYVVELGAEDDSGGGGDPNAVLIDGSRPLIADWNAGNFEIDSRNSTTIFNVVAFGADPTGATDSTAAIQSAIDAAKVAIGPINYPGFSGTPGFPRYIVGATIYFPRGTYTIAGTITIDANAITLEGEGRMMSRLYVTSDAGTVGDPAIRFVGASIATTGQLRKNGLKHLTLYTDNGVSFEQRRTAVVIDFAEEFRGEDVCIYCFGRTAVEHRSVFESSWSDLTLSATGGNAQIGDASQGVFSFLTSAIFPGGQCNNTLIERLEFSGCYGREINIYGGGNTHSGLTFVGITHETSLTDAGGISEASHISIYNAIDITFNNFQFVFNDTGVSHDALAVDVFDLGGGGVMSSVTFSNGMLYTTASSSMIRHFVRVQSTAPPQSYVNFSNVTFYDTLGKVGPGGGGSEYILTAGSGYITLRDCTALSPRAIGGAGGVIEDASLVRGDINLQDVVGAGVMSVNHFYRLSGVLTDSVGYVFGAPISATSALFQSSDAANTTPTVRLIQKVAGAVPILQGELSDFTPTFLLYPPGNLYLVCATADPALNVTNSVGQAIFGSATDNTSGFFQSANVGGTNSDSTLVAMAASDGMQTAALIAARIPAGGGTDVFTVGVDGKITATLSSFANNAAAVGGGLAPGDLYAVTASDPMQIAIVF